MVSLSIPLASGRCRMASRCLPTALTREIKSCSADRLANRGLPYWRQGLEFESTIQSDSAALHMLVAEMLKVTKSIRCMRDPTRGGLSSALNEIAAQSRVGI